MLVEDVDEWVGVDERSEVLGGFRVSVRGAKD